MKQRVAGLLRSRRFSNLLPLMILAAVCLAFFGMTGGKFLSANSIRTMVNQGIITGIIATGGVFVFASNNINIAMGGTTAIAAIVGIAAYNQTGSVAAMMLASVAAAILIMLVCCAMSVVLHIGVVVVTIIMMNLLTSIQKWIMHSVTSVKIDFAVTSRLNKANVPLVLFVLFFLFCAFLFRFTRVGRCIKMVGENAVCSTLTGINEKKYIAIAFIVAGVGAGLGAILTIIRSGSISQDSCQSLNMDVMLAIVLGGMPVTGGYKSKITAGIVGAMMVTVLNTGLLMVGVDSTIIQSIRGICFIILIALSNKRPSMLPVKAMA